MIEILSNISLGLVIVFGFVLIGGFILVANLTDKRNVRHPGGTRGRFKDEALSVAPLVPLLAMILIGATVDGLRENTWWFPAEIVFFVLGFGGFLLPAVRRARKRIEVLNQSGRPSQ